MAAHELQVSAPVAGTAVLGKDLKTMTETNSDALRDGAKSQLIEALLDESIINHTDLEFTKVNGNNSSDINQDTENEMDVDVVGYPSISGGAIEQVNKDDDTHNAEYSSSFGETSESDVTCQRDQSDTESSDSTRASKGFRVFRRKKLTIHWQRYIRSVKWRCNWLELRIKELQTRNVKRKQRLQAAEAAKSTRYATVSAANSSTRAVSLSSNLRSHTMMRKKRKRVEESVDLSVYIVSHIILSLLEKGSDADAGSLDDGLAENGLTDGSAKCHDALAVDHDWPTIDLEETKSTIELLYRQIEALQDRVIKLRAEMNLDDDPEELTLTAAVLPLEATVSRSPSVSPGPPNYLSEYEIEDLPLSEGAVSSFGDAAPNIIESTISLLSADRIARIDVGDEILISNHAAKEELEDFEKVGRALERTPEGGRVSGSETGSEPERATSEEPVFMRRCSGAAAVTYVRRSKRPRTQRRLSPSSWHCETIGRRRSAKTRDHS